MQIQKTESELVHEYSRENFHCTASQAESADISVTRDKFDSTVFFASGAPETKKTKVFRIRRR